MVVERHGNGSRVWLGRADTLLAATEHPEMKTIGADVDRRLGAVRAALSG